MSVDTWTGWCPNDPSDWPPTSHHNQRKPLSMACQAIIASPLAQFIILITDIIPWNNKCMQIINKVHQNIKTLHSDCIRGIPCPFKLPYHDHFVPVIRSSVAVDWVFIEGSQIRGVQGSAAQFSFPFHKESPWTWSDLFIMYKMVMKWCFLVTSLSLSCLFLPLRLDHDPTKRVTKTKWIGMSSNTSPAGNKMCLVVKQSLKHKLSSLCACHRNEMMCPPSFYFRMFLREYVLWNTKKGPLDFLLILPTTSTTTTPTLSAPQNIMMMFTIST